MTKLIINSDDFGYSNGINQGIIKSHQQGVLTSTTLMANQAGFTEAVSLSQKNPQLGIGVHLTLTHGYPLLKNLTSLVDQEGRFISRRSVLENPLQIDLEELYEEWKAQIIKVKEAGINITHLDSHHYMHSMGKNYQVAEQLAKEFDVPIRNSHEVKEKLTNPDIAPVEAFWNLFNYPEMKDMTLPYADVKEKLFAIIEKDLQHYAQFGLVEGVSHPGFVDEDIYFNSSFNLARMREISILCDPDFKARLIVMGYDLINYSDL